MLQTTELTVIERASVALSKEVVEKKITELVQQSKSIVAVTDPESRKVCHEAMMVLKDMRVQTQKRAKEGRDEAVQFSKAVILIEKQLVGLIEPEESRLEKMRDDFDAIKEREKQARIDAEIKRVADIHERIAELRGNQSLSPASGSKLIAEHIADLEKIVVDGTFDEFQQMASDAKIAALKRLGDIHASALTHEAERAELARLRAEAVERDRLAREEQAKRDAEQAERDRVAREAQAKLDADAAALRQAQAKIEADRRALERAEEDRKAAERRAELAREEEEARKRREAEEVTLAAQRAELAAREETIRRAAAPLPIRSRKVPTLEEIIKVLASHYQVKPETAEGWLRRLIGGTPA